MAVVQTNARGGAESGLNIISELRWSVAVYYVWLSAIQSFEMNKERSVDMLKGSGYAFVLTLIKSAMALFHPQAVC